MVYENVQISERVIKEIYKIVIFIFMKNVFGNERKIDVKMKM